MPIRKISAKQPTFEFHIKKASREKYRFDETFFSITGEVIFANFNAARQFAYLINREKDFQDPTEKAVQASEINAMGLLDEIMHFLIEKYREAFNPALFDKIENLLIKNFGRDKTQELLETFAADFPTTEVYRSDSTVKDYLDGYTGDLSNRHVVLEEIIVLWLDNINPSYKPIKDLIDDGALSERTEYGRMFHELDRFFRQEPPFGPENLPLLEMLSLPARKYPHSLSAQLEYIRSQWGGIIGSLLSRILTGMDFMREEQKMRFDAGQFGPGPTYVADFSATEFEPEQFSADLHWMPKVVLIAKSTYVWLDQLSKQYNREIYRLDQIPDEELDRLASYGFTGLWLIGLWERSQASRKIKQMRGNPEAVASAYSLMRYEIAGDLGGNPAYQNLRNRAWRRGIRLASDMVPNHMGIDSDWVLHHPDWFIQSPYPPFPGYNFNCENLCDNDDVLIQIEDGYWHNSDAAVVFKRVDKRTGETRFIYHGNDGTSMPWNDTAQLNYLMPEVREAVIQTILHVARKFPIIRFDAAMTLAKKHYARLWFPQPGTGGDIPSRAEHTVSKEEFDRLFPVEFWREVVDRIQQEVPDTLLLAEAFWMMEGYFVRSLGMHRVYNSAFMNMLKNEENEKYRKSIRNVLEFNPQILKRYVNFMNNPDEDTAIAQFGKDDKYFGVCVLMATMPGLPMFGHGQVEGYHEKYGMEYRRSYWDEPVDEHLVHRHEREIFPLLKRRYLFSDVEHFLLYDLYTPDGDVNENVYAYSNRAGDERTLVLYNNKFDEAVGWVKQSAAYIDDGDLHQRVLAEGLELETDDSMFVIFRDQISGLEFIRSNNELWEQGMYLELGAFKYHVFLDFRQVRRTDARPYDMLTLHLNGRGVPSVEKRMDEFLVQPIIDAFEECINPGSLRWLCEPLRNHKKTEIVADEFNTKLVNLSHTISDFENIAKISEKRIERHVEQYLQSLEIADHLFENERILIKIKRKLKDFIPDKLTPELDFWRVRMTGHFLEAIAVQTDYSAEEIFTNWYLDRAIQRNFMALGAKEAEAAADALLLRCLTTCCDTSIFDMKSPLGASFELMFSQSCIQKYLNFNTYENVVYFNKEKFEHLLLWMLITYLFRWHEIQKPSKTRMTNFINNAGRRMLDLIKQADSAGYQLKEFMLSMES